MCFEYKSACLAFLCLSSHLNFNFILSFLNKINFYLNFDQQDLMSRIPMRRSNRPRRPGRHIARVRHLLPPKPRKPPSGFNLYLGFNFGICRAFGIHQFRRSEVVKLCGETWRSGPAERFWNGRARPELERHRVMLQEYKRKMELVKGPPNVYAIFLHDLWKREGKGKEFAAMGRLGGRKWRGMTVAEKKPFLDEANRAKQAHGQMIEELAAGRSSLDDYVRITYQPLDPSAVGRHG